MFRGKQLLGVLVVAVNSVLEILFPFRLRHFSSMELLKYLLPYLYSWRKWCLYRNSTWILPRPTFQLMTATADNGDVSSSSVSSSPLSGEQRLTLICAYDELVRRRQFETGWYQCNVCLTEKAGRHSLEFYPCGHVFCIDCVNGYFSVQIKDGAVSFWGLWLA